MKTPISPAPIKPLTKTNDRWIWMAAAAASATVAGSAHAQVTLGLNGSITATGDSLSLPLLDISVAGLPLQSAHGVLGFGSYTFGNFVNMFTNGANGVHVVAGATMLGSTAIFAGNHKGAPSGLNGSQQVLTALVTVAGVNSINGGTPTTGILTLTGSASGAGNSITEDSFTYASVPEPTSLAMLALGATGLAALRARRKSA